MNWISCKDEKPKNDERVLICIGSNGFFMAKYYMPNNTFRTDAGMDYDADENVYWLMPESPKK